jgi:hypothetical protein
MAYTPRSAPAAVALTTGAAVEARSAAIDTVKNIVRVHVSNTDASGWRDVCDILIKMDTT